MFSEMNFPPMLVVSVVHILHKQLNVCRPYLFAEYWDLFIEQNAISDTCVCRTFQLTTSDRSIYIYEVIML